jgi:hypothetical protein
VGEEPDDQRIAGADSVDALGGGVGDLGQGGGGQIRQLQVLEVGLQIVDRVELGGVGGRPLGTEPVAWLSSQARIRVLQWADSPSQMSTIRWPA